MDYWFIVIYSFLVLGAIGLFLLLPRVDKTVWTKAGSLAALLSLIGIFFGIIMQSRTALGGEYVWFTIFSAVAVAAAFQMIIQVKALYSALYFILTLLAVAALILLQQAEFLAIALVIVYAGAVLVVYVFVLMLSQQEEIPWYDRQCRGPFLAVIIGFVLLASLLQLILYGGAISPGASTARDIAGSGSAIHLGMGIFDAHMIALQIAALLLLIAAIGAIAVIKHGQRSAEPNSGPTDISGTEERH